MKEILRIRHGEQDDRKDDMLRDYELDVFEGDILYIQGMEGSGVRTLVSLLAGECTLKQGDLYLWGEKAQDYDRNLAYQYKIYTITAEKDLVEELTVAENLEAVRYLPFAVMPYNRKKAEKKVADYLKSEQVSIPAEAYVWALSKNDRQKLSILKAKMHGARMIVLDATSDIYEGQEAEELCELIQRANREGITFLILSEYYAMFAEIASRIQIISEGRDLKEWSKMTERVRQRLRYQTVADFFWQKEKTGERAACFLGMYDYEWEMRGGIWDYLSYVKAHNASVWEEHIGAAIPEQKCSQLQDTVIIPKDSAEYLIKNLSVAENLIMPVPLRVSRRRIGAIKKSIEEKLVQEFYKNTGISPEAKHLEDLNRTQRKILSIYRFELNRPHTVILESPYSGMTQEERECLRSYLLRLSKKGVKIIYFSRSMEEIREDCGQVIVTQNGQGAKITTV